MATRQSRRQLQFTGFEMTVIGVSFVITVTSVFFLGLMVGKKNASLHAPREDRVARVPVDDFTRYKRPAPVAKAGEAAHPATTAKADAPDKASAPATAAVEPVKTVTEPAATVASAKADSAPKDAAATKPKEAVAVETAAKDAAAQELRKEKEKEKPEEAATGRGYTVQILATRKQADADALVRKLKSRGYAAYIKRVSDGAGSWYRVRVGSYGAFSEARAMADKCRRDLGLGQAFVSTE